LNNKTFFLDQHGCAKNQVDGELIIANLENKGWLFVSDPSEASLIIINTCGFIESAKKESLNALISARKSYPNAKILLAGCLAERYAKVFAEELPEADAIFGNGDLSQLDTVLSGLDKGERPIVTPGQKGVCDGERHNLLNFPGSAFVKITEGCNNRCSFCAIPLIRGELRSRPQEAILSEIKDLLSKGVFEINLIGQDLAAFGRNGAKPGEAGDALYATTPSPLSVLLQNISTLPGDFWIRLLYIHPDHFPLDILPLISSDTRILPYFDIPFQSGDNKIIQKMNRVGTKEGYEALIGKIRTNLCDVGSRDMCLRTTFLCGFPSETNESALKTQEFLQNIAPDWSGCFTYSREDDTPAAKMKGQVSSKIATKRVAELQDIQSKITQEKLKRHIGQQYTVLVEEIIPDPEEKVGLAVGRAWFQAPEVDGACVIRYELDSSKEKNLVKPGNVIQVKVLSVSGVDLDTVLIS
jgi:ribosomal protein S12 methylthiotransferase